MKVVKIVYWASTGLFGALMLFSAYLYLSHGEQLVAGMKFFGYPLFLLNILGLAKLLGAIALLVPKFPKLKEWAYAGFAFNLIGAVWSHLAVGDTAGAGNVALPGILFLVSYITYTKLQSKAETRIA